MAGFVPKKLNELNQHSRNAILTTLIVTKTEPNYFLSKISNEFRGVMSFTLRDNKRNLCNCKFWGSKETVAEHNRKMKIGDIISVQSPDVVYCGDASNGKDVFTPRSTLPITLVINEGEGALALYDYRNLDTWTKLQELMHISHKPLSSALTLADVRCSVAADVTSAAAAGKAVAKNGKAAANSQITHFVDLLVMIGGIGKVREIRRNASSTQCLEMTVFDRSSPVGMLFDIWHTEWIKRATQCWRPLKTVLHLIDVGVMQSAYHKSTILRLTKRTVIYENPPGKESDALRVHSLSIDPNMLMGAQRTSQLPDPEEIKTQMTVKQIYMRLEGHLKNDAEQNFTAVLYGMVTKFDIDGFGPIVGRKCKICRRIASPKSNTCESSNCSSTSGGAVQFEPFFNINVQFSDHTGTLVEARLTNGIAESLLKMTAKDFVNSDGTKSAELERIKWLYLLNHVEVKLFIKKSTATRQQMTILVVSMRCVEGLDEMADKIVVF